MNADYMDVETLLDLEPLAYVCLVLDVSQTSENV